MWVELVTGDWCVSALSNINFLFSTFFVIIITNVGLEFEPSILAFYSVLSTFKYIRNSNYEIIRYERQEKEAKIEMNIVSVSRRIEKVGFHFVFFFIFLSLLCFPSVNLPESRITNGNWSPFMITFTPWMLDTFLTFSFVHSPHGHLRFDANFTF